MKRILFSDFALSVLSLTFIFFAGPTQAGQMVFTVDPAQSQLTLSGSIAGYAFTVQAPGSLTTVFSGSINANMSGSTLQFTGASTIAAKTNGVWQPAAGGISGSAVADYGAQAMVPFVGTAYGALRNIILDVSSPSLALIGTNFDSSALIFSATPSSGAVLDYNAPVGGHGSRALTGYSTNTIADGGSLSTNGAEIQLAIKINTIFFFTVLSANDTPITLNGQIVATSQPAVAAPLIQSLVVSNQSLVLTVANATAQSQLLVSTNLMTWSSASSTTNNDGGLIIFTTPMAGAHAFFRVQQ